MRAVVGAKHSPPNSRMERMHTWEGSLLCPPPNIWLRVRFARGRSDEVPQGAGSRPMVCACNPPASAVVHTLTEVGPDTHMDGVTSSLPSSGQVAWSTSLPSLGAVDLHRAQSSKWHVQFTARC